MNKKRTAEPRTTRPPEENPAPASIEQRLLECLVEPLRKTDRRKQSLESTGGSDETVEQALASPVVLGGIAKAQNAFVVEHWPSLLQKLFAAAEEGEAWAWKILLDVAGVAEQLRIASGDVDADLRAELDRSLPEEVRARMIGRTHAEPSLPDSSEPNS